MSVSPDNWNSGVEIAAISDVGMRRSNNQDSHSIVLAPDEATWVSRGHVLIVADGMGAHAAGELASKLAVDNIPHTYYKLRDLAPAVALEKAVQDANTLIHGRGQASADFQGMGTTSTTLVLLPAGALVAHVGDSRIYRLRNHKFEQLSCDHSLVWEMIAAGQITEGDVPAYVPKNVITRSLGPNARVEVDLEGPLPLEVGDVFLICSDGLTGPVRDEEIGVVLDSVPVGDAIQTLVDLANLRGGPDNITAVALRVTEGMRVQPAQAPTDRETSPTAGPLAVWIWAAVGACLLAAIVLFGLGNPRPAWLSLSAAVVAAALAWVLNREQRSPKGAVQARKRLGNAPYRSYEGKASRQFVEKYGETIAKLRAAAKKDDWVIDWPRFEAFQQRADAAIAEKNYSAAVLEYSGAIRFIVSELRNGAGEPGRTP